MAIDLGTANTLIYLKNRGIVLNEPSVVALSKAHNPYLPYAFGLEAKRMVGRTSEDVEAIRPLKDGVIADFKVAEEMLKHFIKAAIGRRSFRGPRIIICVPSGSTPVERRAIQEAAECAGAKEVFLIEEPMAAAIGAGLPVTEPRGSMIVDIGGGTTEVAVLSLGGIVYSCSIRTGGDTMDTCIVDYIRANHNLLIGTPTAEDIKTKVCIADATAPTSDFQPIDVVGVDLSEHLPKTLTLNKVQIAESLTEPVSKIIKAIRTALEFTPPELCSDIASKGITLTGGGALLKNLDKVITASTRLPVTIAEDPLSCVVLGTGEVLKKFKELRHTLFKQD